MFAAIDWLVQGARAAPTTGASTPPVPLIAQVWTAARASEAPAAALRRLLRSSDEHLAPVCELGPVGRGASHWQGSKWVKEMDLAWPFAAVLDYDQDGQPEAYIDWFRRAADAQSPDAWLLDPGVGYVEHINAELKDAVGPRERLPSSSRR